MSGNGFPKCGRVLFSATLVRGHIAKFHIPYLKWFKEQGWETWVAAKNDYPDRECKIPYCDHFVNIDFARSPFSKQTFVAYGQLKNLFMKEDFDIVHTHTPVGGVLTRLAACEARRTGTKVIYTAHGFHFYDGAPLVNWLLWYPAEKMMSGYTDLLLTINHEDYIRARKFANCNVGYVPGVGIDTKRFKNSNSRDVYRRLLGLKQGQIGLLAVGDLIQRKNHQAILRALAQLDDRFKLIICGTGVEENNLKVLARSLGLQESISFLGFRNDIDKIMNACDVFVFPSIHEGLPVSVMEAMASGLPVVASDIRGIAPDLIQDGQTGLLVKDADPSELSRAIARIVNDEDLRIRIVDSAIKNVESFSLDVVVPCVADYYGELL